MHLTEILRVVLIGMDDIVKRGFTFVTQHIVALSKYGHGAFNIRLLYQKYLTIIPQRALTREWNKGLFTWREEDPSARAKYNFLHVNRTQKTYGARLIRHLGSS